MSSIPDCKALVPSERGNKLSLSNASTERRCLVSLRPDHTPRAWFTCENAFSVLCRIVEWDNSNGNFEIALDLFFDLTRAVPVCQGKATMNFGFLGIRRSKEIVEFLFGIDYQGVIVAEFCREIVKIFLNRRENFRRAPHEFLNWYRFFRFYPSIAPAYFDGIFLQIARV